MGKASPINSINNFNFKEKKHQSKKAYISVVVLCYDPCLKILFHFLFVSIFPLDFLHIQGSQRPLLVFCLRFKKKGNKAVIQILGNCTLLTKQKGKKERLIYADVIYQISCCLNKSLSLNCLFIPMIRCEVGCF